MPSFYSSLLGIIIISLASLHPAHGGSAPWKMAAASGDWDTPHNWNPATVPNGVADVATFDVSIATAVSVSAATIVDSIRFNAVSSSYAINSAVPSDGLTIEGVGILNQSGLSQNFVALTDTTGTQGGSFIKRLGARRR